MSKKRLMGVIVSLVLLFGSIVLNSETIKKRVNLSYFEQLKGYGNKVELLEKKITELHPLVEPGHGETLLKAAATTATRFVYSSTPVWGDIWTQTDIYVISQTGANKVAVANDPDGEIYQTYAEGYIFYYLYKDSFHIDLHAVRPDGSGRIIIADGPENEVLITVKNRWVIFGRNYDEDQEKGDIYAYNLDDDQTFNLGENIFYKDIVGDRMVFAQKETQNEMGFNLYSIKLDGTSLVAIAPAEGDEHYMGQVSNYYVVFAKCENEMNDDNIYSIPVDGSMDRPIVLAKTADNEYFEGIASGRVIFSADNGVTRNLFSILPNGNSKKNLATGNSVYKYSGVLAGRCYYVDTLSNTFYSKTITGTDRVNLGNVTAIPYLVGILGNYLIFDDFHGSKRDYYSVRLTGGNKIELATLIIPQFGETAHIDYVSNKFIINRSYGSGFRDIKSINANGTGLKTISVTQNDEYYAFSTSNRYIFLKNVNDQWDIFSILFSISNQKNLTNNPDCDEGFLTYEGPINN